MAGFSDTVKIVIDVVTNGATSGLNDVKSKVAEAEGSFGKLKAGASGAFSTIGAAGPLAVAGVGAAVGAFTAKAIGDFENLALSAESFSKVAGTTVQDASRWIEVASDLGVGTDAVQGAMARLNREAEQGKLAQFGIDATNANDRLIQSLQYLSGITDETQRSQAAFQLFGKSAASLAPLIASASELKGRMDDVEGAKIISPENVADARKFRDDMDRVTDAVDNLVLSAGKIALPFVDAVTQVLGPVSEFIAKLSDAREAAQGNANKSGSSWTDNVVGFFTQTGPEAADFFLNKMDEISGGTGDRFGKAGDAALKLGDVVEAQGQKFVVLGKETKNVTGLTDDQIRALVSQDASLQTSAGSADELTASQGALAKSAADAAKADADLAKAHDDATAAALAQLDSLAQLDDQLAGNTTSLLGAQTQQIKTNQALQDYGKQVNDAKVSTDDHTVALNNMTLQVIDTGQKTGDAATAQTTYATETDKAVASINTQISYLQAVASTLAPGDPLRANLEAYIDQLNGIKENINTEVTANTDQALAKLRELQAYIQRIAGGADIPIGFPGAATGGYHSGVTELGEDGRELIRYPDGSTELVGHTVRNLPPGTYVNDAAMTKTMLSQTAGAGINGPVSGGAPAAKSGQPAKLLPGMPQYGYTPDQMFAGGNVDEFGQVWDWPQPAHPLSYGVSYQQPSVGQSSSRQFYADAHGNTSWTVPIAGQKAALPDGAAVAAAAARASVTNNITINMPPGSNGDDVVRALKQYERRNGTVPIKTL